MPRILAILMLLSYVCLLLAIESRELAVTALVCILLAAEPIYLIILYWPWIREQMESGLRQVALMISFFDGPSGRR